MVKYISKAWRWWTRAKFQTPIKKITSGGQKRLVALRKEQSFKPLSLTTKSFSCLEWPIWFKTWCSRQRLLSKIKNWNLKLSKPNLNLTKWCPQEDRCSWINSFRNKVSRFSPWEKLRILKKRLSRSRVRSQDSTVQEWRLIQIMANSHFDWESIFDPYVDFLTKTIWW